MASNNSYLVPHYDSAAHNNKIKKSCNLIYFIDGYNGDLNSSGAIRIYKHSKFKMLIIITNNIKILFMYIIQNIRFLSWF